MSALKKEYNFLIGKFRKRARSLKVVSYAILIMITFLLVAGISLFALADVFTSLSSIKAESELLQKMGNTLSKIEPEIDNILPQLEDSIEQYNSMLQSQDMTQNEMTVFFEEATETLNSFNKSLKENRETKVPEDYEIDERLSENMIEMTDIVIKNINMIDFEGLLGQITAILSELSDFSSQLENTAEDSANLVSNYNEYVELRLNKIKEGTFVVSNTMVSSVVLRIGALSIMFFLVQILVNLYRYNIRLSSFYESRADALELLSSEENMNIETIIAVLSPEKITFDPAIQSPIQHLSDVAKTVASKK